MIKMFKQGVSQGEIAKKMGISQARVSQIIVKEVGPDTTHLTAKQMQAYRLVYIANLSVKQAAIIMRCKPRNIYKHLYAVFAKYPSLRAGQVTPKEMLVADFTRLENAGKIVQKW